MRLQDIDPLIASLGLPYAYYEFNKTAQAPPYIVYYSPGRDDLYADNENYQHILELDIELYTQTKRWDIESSIDEKLNAAGLTYAKTEAKIESDGLFQILYETEVLINAQD